MHCRRWQLGVRGDFAISSDRAVGSLLGGDPRDALRDKGDEMGLRFGESIHRNLANVTPGKPQRLAAIRWLGAAFWPPAAGRSEIRSE